ncbi:MAG: hypothetical protein J6Z18_06980 [Prevotella sp.]|nr:hypothetical protein [Prevotella sp.]
MKGNKAKHINNIILALTALLLALVCMSIVLAPIRFSKEREQREQAVKSSLTAIRQAQEKYCKNYGEYAHSFAKLIQEGLLPDTLQYVPYAGHERFKMATGMFQTKSGKQIPLMECSVDYKTFLKGLSKSEIRRITEEALRAGKFPGMKIGDLTTPNDNAGNWE